MQRDRHLFGWLALALGGSGTLIGAGILIGALSQPAGAACKAFCGLALLATTLLGEPAGQLVGGLLWLAAGAVFCWVGFRVLKD